MKRIIISVEGQTEQEFVKSVLLPFFHHNGIYDVRPILIKKTGGGLVNYAHIRNDVAKYVHEHDVIVTTFVDYFRLPKSFPKKEEAIRIGNINDRLEFLEEAFAEDIAHRNFLPYIQKHEFEALLFSSDSGFVKYFDTLLLPKIHDIMEQYPNPEDINDNPETAPSKRLIKIINGYDKILFGNIIALEIGIETILHKCPRFNQWLNKLITMAH